MKQNRAEGFTKQHDLYDCGVACLRNILLIRQGYALNLRITGGFFRSIRHRKIF